MLLAVLSVCSPEELEDDTLSEDELADQALINQATSPEDRHARREQIKNKIRAVGRLQVMFQNLRYGATSA
jgi:serine/threonine-protein phosphatase 2B catalytic subunit